MSDDKLARVKAIIAEQLEVSEDEITEDTDLIKDLEADSLDIVEMVMAFEEEFGGKISDEELKKIRTVNDILKAIG